MSSKVSINTDISSITIRNKINDTPKIKYLNNDNEETINAAGIYDLDIMDTFADPNLHNQETLKLKPKPKHIFMFLTKSDIPLLLLAFFTMSISAVAAPVATLLYGKVFSTLSDYYSGEIKTFGEFIHTTRNHCFALTALGAGLTVIIWFGLYLWLQIGEIQSSRARKQIFSSFFVKKFEWFDMNTELNGELNQINRCIEELRSGCSEIFALLVQNIATIIALLVTAFIYSWSLTLIILASSPIIMASGLYFGGLIAKNAKLENDLTSNSSKYLNWSLTSPQLVRLFLGKSYEIKKFNNSCELSASAFFKMTLAIAANVSILRSFALIMFVQGFWFGTYMVREGHLKVNQVFTCFTACLMLGQQINTSTSLLSVLQKGKVAAAKISNFLNDDSANEITKNSNILLYPSECFGGIKFKKIDFSYPSRSDTKILKKVNITIPSEELVFIVGKSGSGKSTLSQLLMSFYKPSSGRIEIDGFDVQTINPKWLTDNITLVQQSCTLFNDSIKNNIGMGIIDKIDSLANIKDDDIRNAAKFSNLNQMLLDLPDGIETMVSAKGSSLSGGQIQRVALARAKIRDTPILILDEAVSALDIINRDLLIKSIKTWRKGKTTIIMTHEFSQIDDNDYVYLMENGTVGERGFKKELADNASGLFYRLLNVDSQDDQPVDIFADPIDSEIEFDNRSGIRDSIVQATETFNRLSGQFFGIPLGMESEARVLSTINLDDSHSMANNSVSEYFQNQRHSKAMEYNQSIFTTRSNISAINKLNEKLAFAAEIGEKDVSPAVNSDENPVELMSVFQILKFMRSNIQSKAIIILGIISAIINGIVNPVFSFCFSKLLNGLITTKTHEDNNGFLLKWSLIVIAIAIADGATTFGKMYFLSFAAEKWILDLRKTTFRKISEQDVSWFDKANNKPAEITALLMNDSRDLRNLVSGFLSVFCNMIVLLLLGVIWSLVIGWKLSLVGVSFVPVFMIVTVVYSSLLQNSENQYKIAVASLENLVHEAVNGMKTIVCLRLNKYFFMNFDDNIAKLRFAGHLRAFKVGFGISLSGLITYTAQGTILYYGMRLVGLGEYTSGQLMEIFTLLIFSMSTASTLLSQIPDISRGQRAGTYIIRLLSLEPSPTENEGSVEPHDYSKTIQFKNVSFAYPMRPNAPVLKNMTFSILNGETVGIIGESGSGKSTINSLVTRLYSTGSNSIFVNNRDINIIDINWLRSNIAVVSQQAQFFDGSIKENLLYGLEEGSKSDADIEDALKLANIYDFVVSLPEALETRLGESSNSLISGGQAQRLSIARALIRNPKILILDECTSSLDPENSKIIADLVKKNLTTKEGLTTLLITHSEDMMKSCGRIITLKDGAICEEGGFDDLYNNEGELYRLVNGDNY